MKQTTTYKSIVLTFLLYPIISLALIVKNIDKKIARIFLLGFYFICGLKYVISSSEYDSYAHVKWFFRTSLLTWEDFWDKILYRFSFEGLNPDIFQFLLEFLVSRVTINEHFYLGVLTLILGLFLVFNIKELLHAYKENQKLIIFLFIVFIIILYPPFRIGSFRHNCASLLFSFFLIKHINTKRLVYVLLLGLTTFIHLGFIIPFSLYLLFFIIGSQPLLYLALVGISFLIAPIFPDLMFQSASFFSGSYQVKSIAYTNSNFITESQKLASSSRLIISQFITWTNWFLFLSSIFWVTKTRRVDRSSMSIFCFTLLLFSFINLSSVIISISARFSLLYQLLCCIFFIKFFEKNEVSNSWIFNSITTLFMALNFIIIFRQGSEFMNISLLFPIIATQLIPSDTAIVELIEWLQGFL